MSAPFEAIILAGGLGTRLRSVVADRPKVMALVGGVPFLSLIVRALKNFGVRRIVLSIGYLGEQIEKYFGSSFEGIEIIYSKEETPLGTGGGVARAAQHITTDHVIILNGDSWVASDLEAFFAFHLSTGAPVSMLLSHVDDCGRYGSVEISKDGKIESFKEKDPSKKAGWINGGMYLVSSSLIKSIGAAEKPISLEKELLPKWLNGGIFGYKSTGAFLDIGTPESFKLAEQFAVNFSSSQTVRTATQNI